MTNLASITPCFIVANLKASVACYVDQLGFKVMHIGPDEDPFFAIVGRGNISIMLKAIADNIKPAPNHTRHEWARWDAYIYTKEPDALYEEYRENGVMFLQPIQNDADNLRGFEIADADGYVLYFGRPWP